MKKIKSLLRNDQGATLIEYGLIVAVVGLAVATMLFSFGETITGTFTTVGTTIEDTQP
jgi:pilus assembly protein Flp/PilA|tara:strand:+ start:16355 stop:16528 length:174 start_codon:yes stop_codon:yes gene_type:complete